MSEPWKNDDDDNTPQLMDAKEAGEMRDYYAREAAALMPALFQQFNPGDIFRNYIEKSPPAFEGPCMGMASAIGRMATMMALIMHTTWSAPMFDPQVAYRLRQSSGKEGEDERIKGVVALYGRIPTLRENYRKMLLGLPHTDPAGKENEGDKTTVPSVLQVHMFAALMMLRDIADDTLSELVTVMREAIAMHPDSEGAINLKNCLNGIESLAFVDKAGPKMHYYEPFDPARHTVPASLAEVPDPEDPSEGRPLGNPFNANPDDTEYR